MDLVSRWHHCLVLAWGHALDHIRLNSIRFDRVHGSAFVSKRRRWYARFLIPIGNVYLRQIGARTFVLSNHAWRLWESEVYRQAYGSVLLTDAQSWLQIPLWSGCVLADYLAAASPSVADKLRAIRLVADSLRRLHQLQVRWPDGQQRPFSHGDATVRNVIVSRQLERATWFDFDMAHDQNEPDAWRHADDLRALIYSAAKWFPKELYLDITQSVLTSYAETTVTDMLSVSVIQSRDRPNSFHLAQSGLSYDQNREISTAILTAIAVN